MINIDEFTPESIERLEWSIIEETCQKNSKPSARELYNFINSADIKATITDKGSVKTNVIDQGEKKTYSLNPNQYH